MTSTPTINSQAAISATYSAMIYNPNNITDQCEFRILDRRNLTPREIWQHTEEAMHLLGWQLSAMRIVTPKQSAWYPKHLFCSPRTWQPSI